MSAPAIVPGDETPDLDEMQGRERAAIAIPVRIEGPVDTRKLPARASATRNQAVTSAEPVRVLHADLSRARAYIRAKDQPVYLAFSREEAAGVDCWLMQSTDPPLMVETADEVWVRAVTTATVVMVLTEIWTF